GALLVLAHKAGLDIDATRERFPRLATLPFDPTYKLMAVFVRADGGVRCFVKGAAPAVVSHAASDDALAQQAGGDVRRMEEQGLRVMAAGVCDVDGFDPGG